MFLKPYKVKSNTPLKGSETKRLRQRLEKAFPHVPAEQLHNLFPGRANVTLLKMVTHSDMQTCAYCVEKLPMFFEIENNVLVPTLYALWQLPELLPYFTTMTEVLPNLNNGADLMLPGVIPQGTGMNLYGRYKKNQLVAVNLTSNKNAVGVGILPRSSDDLFMSGGRGSAVKMLHIFGDKLWGHEPALAKQVPPEVQEQEQEQDAEESTVLSELNVDNEAVNENNVVEETIEPKISSDELLRNAFLAALKNHGKSLTLPLLTSTFYKLYVVPETEENFDLKKTSYKKLSNFLKEMSEQGFLVVREESKGVDKITSIDLQHEEVVNFITDFKPQTNTDIEGNQEQPLFHSSLTELYVVTDATAAFFTKMNYKRGEGIPATQINHIIREYISKFELKLIDQVKRAVQLDETLQQLCNCEQATTKQIYTVITQKMEHKYQMCTSNTVTANKPCIQMSLATRSGNKKVTLVSNIDCYGIIMPEFIRLCKQGAAASTTMIKLPSQKREQLQIQGNQVRFVYNLLTETYKVPAKCILGLELAAKEKKKKK